MLLTWCASANEAVKNEKGHNRRDLLARAAALIASEAKAAGADWHVLSELLKGAALEAGLEPHATSEMLQAIAAESRCNSDNRLWAAVRWVYDEKSQSFYAKVPLNREQFHDWFAGAREVDDFGGFLLAWDLIDRAA